MLITTGGQLVRIKVGEIREAGRNTMGVKLINLETNDKLQAIAPVISEETDVPDTSRRTRSSGQTPDLIVRAPGHLVGRSTCPSCR